MNMELRKTAISSVQSGEIRLRGYPITELIGQISWGEAVYLTIAGELPPPGVGRLMDAVLVSVIDHGPTPVSTLAARTVASGGATLNASVAAGILAIAKHHGGAIADCMKVLQDGVARGAADVSAVVLVEEFRKRGERVPGFGHRQHASDPRTRRLFEVAAEEGFAGKFVAQAQALEFALQGKTKKPVPINADGAIAAILCEIHFPPEAANGIFMIARVAGLVAHSVEEQARNTPLRPIHPTDYEYDGPKDRTAPKRSTCTGRS